MYDNKTFYVSQMLHWRQHYHNNELCTALKLSINFLSSSFQNLLNQPAFLFSPEFGPRPDIFFRGGGARILGWPWPCWCWCCCCISWCCMCRSSSMACWACLAFKLKKKGGGLRYEIVKNKEHFAILILGHSVIFHQKNKFHSFPFRPVPPSVLFRINRRPYK